MWHGWLYSTQKELTKNMDTKKMFCDVFCATTVTFISAYKQMRKSPKIFVDPDQVTKLPQREVALSFPVECTHSFEFVAFFYLV